MAALPSVKLYEIIFWGAEGHHNDEDTIYLVRALDWRAAVEFVQANASSSHHKIHKATLAHRVHEIGSDLSSSDELRPQILRGPYFQSAYNHGWRAWNRKIESGGYTLDWAEETHGS